MKGYACIISYVTMSQEFLSFLAGSWERVKAQGTSKHDKAAKEEEDENTEEEDEGNGYPRFI